MIEDFNFDFSSGMSKLTDVLKELNNPTNANTVTRLQIHHIQILAKVNYYYLVLEEKKNPIDALNKTLNLIKELYISLDAESRKETIEGLKGLMIYNMMTKGKENEQIEK